MSAKVSVCIPTYNQPEFFEQTLKSVLEQDYTNYEIIITDDSEENVISNIVQKYMPNKKIKYYRNKTAKGSPENWNEAISKSSGEYIKILHHDDWFTQKDSLRKFVQALDENPDIDFCFCATRVSNPNKELIRIHSPSEKQLNLLKKDPTILFFGNFIGAPSVTIYRRHIEDQYDQKMKWLVDLDLYIKVLKKHKFHYIQSALIATTSEASHQVTEECVNNKYIEVYEYIYLYYKIYQESSYDLSNHLKSIFYKYDILIPSDLNFLDKKIVITDEIRSVLKYNFFLLFKRTLKRMIK